MSNLIVCTDAGLSSKSNKQFNSISNRNYITVQSLKKLKQHLKEWALNPKGWKTINGSDDIDISNIELVGNNATYYKERWIKENGLEERLIISFSPKYKLYQESIRTKQIDRACKIIEKNHL